MNDPGRPCLKIKSALAGVPTAAEGEQLSAELVRDHAESIAAHLGYTVVESEGRFFIPIQLSRVAGDPATRTPELQGPDRAAAELT